MTARREVGADAQLAELAAAQHGVVARHQLIALGLGRGGIARRLEVKRLQSVHAGVYAVGHRAIGDRGHLMAAVLACGAGAVLSHRAAARLWGLRVADTARIEVTAPRRVRVGRRLHVRHSRLPPDERTVVEGIPATTVARTLLDLAAVVGPERLRRAIEQAEAWGLADSPSLPELVVRYPGRRGLAKLRRVLAEADRFHRVTRSHFENRFLTFLERRDLPLPETNVWVELGGTWVEADCVWREARLIVELDSRAFHADPTTFEADRQRDRRAGVAGWRVVRVTERALFEDADALEADLRALLATSARRATR